MKLGGLVVAATLGVLGCQRGPGEAGGAADRRGHERGECRPNQGCDPGLWCLSDRCVRPPAADCRVVAAQLASIELGNYAPVADRAPTLARFHAACEQARVSKEQGACLAQAADLWSAAQCAPAMFPERTAAAAGDCQQIANRLRGELGRQVASGTSPDLQQMFTKVMAVVQQSCEQDGWPAALKQCFLTSADSSAGLEACSRQMSAALQQKVTARITAAMQR